MSKKIISEYLSQKTAGEKATSPKVSLTMALLEWLPIQDFDYEVASDKYPGLRCRVRSGGTKAIVVAKKIDGGRFKRVTLCKVGEKTLADVVTDYHQTMNDISQGNIGGTIKPSKITLREAMKAYIKDTHLAPRTVENYNSVIDVYLVDWADQPLISITPEKVKARFDQITNREITNGKGQKRGGPSAANTTMKVIRALFNFMQEEAPLVNGMPTFPPSPTLKLNPSKGRRKKKSSWNEERPREGRIELDSLSAWWAATEALEGDYRGDGELGRDYLQFLLLTGMRRNEATQLEWSDVTKKQLTVRNTKNGNPLVLPITPALKEILDRRKGTDKPFPVTEPRRFMRRVAEQSGVEFTLHDLRRTFAGYAEHYCELPEKIISVLLNHTTDKTITSRYIGDVGLQKKAEKLAIVQGFILTKAKQEANVTAIREVQHNG
jgi:integrase